MPNYILSTGISTSDEVTYAFDFILIELTLSVGSIPYTNIGSKVDKGSLTVQELETDVSDMVSRATGKLSAKRIKLNISASNITILNDGIKVEINIKDQTRTYDFNTTQ